jgi:RTX calcium-binding nonapeptide repeat (4 copies)
MARMGTPRPPAPPAIAAGIAAVAAVVSLAGGQAIGGGGSICAPPNATFEEDVPGEKIRMSAGYERHPAPDFDFIGQHHKGVDALGDPLEGAGSCGDEDKFQTLTVILGDRGDRLRLDGRKPKVLSGGRVPKFVAVTAFGGPGRDTLRGHKGPDAMNGEGGNDVIKVSGGGADIANCGPGNDTAFLSGADQAVGCEHAG